MEIFEGLGIAADVGVSAATPPAAPTVSFPAASSVPVSAIFTASVSVVRSVPASVFPTPPLLLALVHLIRCLLSLKWAVVLPPFQIL
ncbi:uncharacterized protein LOC112030129 isoform X3 [Quercus suber]|uniref:uncharacterized protein LOC112030129 isoform X3 n=1 Tax=Quercus suber TaxID=58331 RepID=UPI0032DE97CC